MRSRTLVLLLAVLSSSAAAPALAADPSPGVSKPANKPKDRADELFLQGLAAFDAKRLPDAERLLGEALALKRTYDIAGDLGIVKLHLGKPSEAAELITWALRNFPPTESSSVRKGLEQELQKARAQVGALRVRVNVEGAEIEVNGRAAGKAPLKDDVFVDPGPVKIVARHDGYMAAEQTVEVVKGTEARDVSLTLVPIGGKSEKRSVVPGAVMGGVAGAALITGIGLIAGGAAKRGNAHDLHDAILEAGHSCVKGAANFDSRCASLESAASASNTLGRAGVGALIGAGVLGAGAAIYLLWPEPSARPSGSRSIRVAPMASTTGGGVFFSGAF